MKPIEAIQVKLSFGHYESHEDQTFFIPQYVYNHEVTQSTKDHILNDLIIYKQEILRMIGAGFLKFINDYKKGQSND